MLPKQGKQGAQNAKGSDLASHPVRSFWTFYLNEFRDGGVVGSRLRSSRKQKRVTSAGSSFHVPLA